MTIRMTSTYPGRTRQRGFTMAELLVGSVLGLFIIAGAASVFTANRESARIGERVQTNQEAIRYVTQTITRLVRAGDSFKGTNVQKLVVSFADDLPEDVLDCLGAPAAGGSNSFTTALNADTGKYELLCKRDSDTPQALIDGLAPPSDKLPNLEVQLLRPSLISDCPQSQECLGELQVAAAEEATSAEIVVRIVSPVADQEIEDNAFIATMRCAVLECKD